MSLADDISQAMSETPEPERKIFPGTINSVSPLTVTLDGSGVAVPCLYFGGVTLAVSRRVGVIKVGSDLVVFGSFGDDLQVPGTVSWGASEGAKSLPSVPAGVTSLLTTYAAIAGSGFSFTSPPSGKVLIEIDAVINILIANGFGFVSFQIRAGSTVGSGAISYAPLDQYAAEFRASTVGMFAKSHAHRLVTLTPNTVYNIEAQHRSNAASSTQSLAVTLTVIPTI